MRYWKKARRKERADKEESKDYGLRGLEAFHPPTQT
jgi:hypothetical protein